MQFAFILDVKTIFSLIVEVLEQLKYVGIVHLVIQFWSYNQGISQCISAPVRRKQLKDFKCILSALIKKREI